MIFGIVNENKNMEGNGHALFTYAITFLLHMSDVFYGKENVSDLSE
jgi:hypothetical protein